MGTFGAAPSISASVDMHGLALAAAAAGRREARARAEVRRCRARASGVAQLHAARSAALWPCSAAGALAVPAAAATRQAATPAASLCPLIIGPSQDSIASEATTGPRRVRLGPCWRSAASSTPRGRRRGCGGRSRRSCRRCVGCSTSPASRSSSSTRRTRTSAPPRRGSPPTPCATRSCRCSTGPTSPSARASPRPRWRPAARCGSSGSRTGRAPSACTTGCSSASTPSSAERLWDWYSTSSFLSCPVRTRDGRILGVLAIARSLPQPAFSAEDLRVTEVLADLAAFALERAQLLDDEEALGRAARAVSATLDPGEVVAAMRRAGARADRRARRAGSTPRTRRRGCAAARSRCWPAPRCGCRWRSARGCSACCRRPPARTASRPAASRGWSRSRRWRRPRSPTRTRTTASAASRAR